MTLGIAGEPELSIATLAATNSNTDEAEDGTKIATLFFPPSRHGLHLQKDEKSKTLWSDFFYTCEDGVITPVRTNKPIQIDSVIPYKLDSSTECDDDYFPGRNMLEEITSDKWKTQEVLLRSGISVPSTLFLPAEYVADTEAAIQTFAQAYSDGFVVKATHGSQGNSVRLFDQTALGALPYAHSLQEEGKDIVLQERIIPHPLILPEEKVQIDQHDVDHNLRVLVTIGEDPLILDAEIRYAEKSGKPVNVSRGAHALKSHNLLRSLPPEMLFDMYDTSIRASRALYEATGGKIYDTVGYIGLDVIIDREGKATVIEANSGCVGGLGTLSRIAREPLKSVGEKLLLSAQPVLQRNHEKRLGQPEGHLTPLALENNDIVDVAQALYFAGQDIKAEQFLREYDGEFSQVFYSVLNGDRLREQEEYEKAIAEYADVFLFDDSQYLVAEGISQCLLNGGLC